MDFKSASQKEEGSGHSSITELECNDITIMAAHLTTTHSIKIGNKQLLSQLKILSLLIRQHHKYINSKYYKAFYYPYLWLLCKEHCIVDYKQP